MVETIERTIHFYKINFKKDNLDVDVSTIFSTINSLPIGTEARYYALPDGNMWSMYVDSQNMFIKARIGTKRVKGLPSIEEKGIMLPLTIPHDAGLYEPTHFMIFDQNILASEFNFYGPRITSLRGYICTKLPHLVDEVELLPLMNKDFNDIIANMGGIRKFKLRIHRDFVELTRELNESLHSAFRAAKNVGSSEEIEITLSVKSHSRHTISVPFLSQIGRWLLKPEVKDNVDVLKVRAIDRITEEVKEYDLLEEYVLARRPVVKEDENHKSVSTEDMYRVIHETYNELKPSINKIIGNGR